MSGIYESSIFNILYFPKQIYVIVKKLSIQIIQHYQSYSLLLKINWFPLILLLFLFTLLMIVIVIIIILFEEWNDALLTLSIVNIEVVDRWVGIVVFK